MPAKAQSRLKDLKSVIPVSIMATAFTALSGCTVLTPETNSKLISAFPTPTHWQALSTTASAITGDITLADTQITFANKTKLTLEPIEHNENAGQTLFKVTSKTNPELLNGNLLCGSRPVDYLVTQISGNVPGQSDLQLMAYYYPGKLRLSDLPLKDLDSLDQQMCALYTYVATPK